MSELITHFEARIHPGYHCLNRKPQTTDRTHKRLMQLGDQRMGMLAANPQTLLLYFSPLSSCELRDALQQAEPHPLVVEEINRLYKGKCILGERFIVFGWSEHPLVNIPAILQRRGIAYHPQSSLAAYGEYLGFCVKSVGGLVKQQLGIEQDNYYLIPGLSRPGSHLKRLLPLTVSRNPILVA